jgi:putative transposase
VLDKPLPNRQSIRLPAFDYRSGGAYFVTICTRNRECIFGSIEQGKLRPSRRGLVAQSRWADIPAHHENVTLDAFVLMPNHLHGVVFLNSRATQVSPLQLKRPAMGPTPGSLGAIMGSFKSAVSREINRRRPGAGDHLWQRNYYEHVIRNDRSLYEIRTYILGNPQRWEHDRENPDGDGSDCLDRFVNFLSSLEIDGTGDAGVAPTEGLR